MNSKKIRNVKEQDIKNQDYFSQSYRDIITDSFHLGLRKINIFGDIDENMAKHVLAAMDLLEAANPKSPIHIEIMSDGGSWTHGVAIYDRINRSMCKTVCFGHGQVSSTATAIFQAADERVIGVNCSFLIHDGEESFEGTPKSFESWALASKLNRNLLYDIYASRSGRDPKYWESKCSHDTYLTAAEVVAEGLADRIEKPKKRVRTGNIKGKRGIKNE